MVGLGPGLSRQGWPPPRPTQREVGIRLTAERVPAAVGLAHEAVLVAAVIRRSRSVGIPITAQAVRHVLRTARSTGIDEDGQWHLASPREPAARDQRMLELAPPGTTLTAREMRGVLVGAGYSTRRVWSSIAQCT